LSATPRRAQHDPRHSQAAHHSRPLIPRSSFAQHERTPIPQTLSRLHLPSLSSKQSSKHERSCPLPDRPPGRISDRNTIFCIVVSKLYKSRRDDLPATMAAHPPGPSSSESPRATKTLLVLLRSTALTTSSPSHNHQPPQDLATQTPSSVALTNSRNAIIVVPLPAHPENCQTTFSTRRNYFLTLRPLLPSVHPSDCQFWRLSDAVQAFRSSEISRIGRNRFRSTVYFRSTAHGG